MLSFKALFLHRDLGLSSYTVSKQGLSLQKYFNCKGLFLVLVSLAVLQTGCLRGTKQPSSQVAGAKASDFRLLEIQGRSIEKKSSEVWSFPTQKTYEFRACLIGRTTQSPLASGQEFRIIKPDGTSYSEKTDDLGCVNWKETQHFNFMADSVYLKKTRIIKGVGVYKGQVEVSLGVNPWLEYRGDIGSEVVDLNRSNIAQESIIDESIDDDPEKSGLFSRGYESTELQIDPELNVQWIPVKNIKDGKTLKMILRTQLFVEAMNLRGEPVKFPLSTGRFKVYAQLISNYIGEDSKQHALLTPGILPSVVNVERNGSLSLTMDFNLKRQIHMGQVQLALKIEPVHAPVKIRPYQGLHNVGGFMELLGKTSATQIAGHLSQTRFDYAEFVKSAANFEDLKKTGIAKDLPPVDYSLMDARFVRIKSGETSTHRTVVYRVSTIVTDSITGAPVVYQNFKIKKHFNDFSVEESVTSDKYGMLVWSDEISHAYYKPEQYFFPQFTVTEVASTNTQKLTLGLNPWDEGWTFGRDTRNSEADFEALAKDDVRKPMFVIDAFRYQTIRFRYVIDEYLTLNVKKAVVMALDPLVQRFTIKDGRKFEPLRDGIYLVKVALVKFYIDPFQNNTRLYVDDQGRHTLHMDGINEDSQKGEYTTVIKKLVRVQAGRITTPLEFSMRDIRMMSIRSSIMVQIETIDENRLIRDNLVNDHMSQIFEDYLEFNAEGMSEEDKKAFLAEKRAQYEEEVKKLRDEMELELAKLREKRDEESRLYEERANLLEKLVSRLADHARNNSAEVYEQNMRLSREEFEAKFKKARDEMDRLEKRMKEYWEKWDQKWANAQLTNQGSGVLSQIPLEHLSTKPSYADYLGMMQIFMDDYGLGSMVGYDDLKGLQLNNYTTTSVAPLIDLNYYRNDSGLERRTFIGPCTLVENDNMSELRPTDTIDEIKCDTGYCSQDVTQGDDVVKLDHEDNSEFEGSAYHDSFKPFAEQFKHVDSIIDLHIKNELHYQKEMRAFSQLANFVERYNLDYVSLKDIPLKKFKQGCEYGQGESCFEETKENTLISKTLLGMLNASPTQDLVQRYFYVKPLHKLNKVTEQILRENTLQPLWEKATGLLGSFFDDSNLWETGVPYASRGIGNRYLHTAADYMRNKVEADEVTFDHKDVSRWLDTGLREMNLVDGVKLCHTLTQNAMRHLRSKNLLDESESFWNPPKKTSEEYLLEYCFSKIHFVEETDKVVFTGGVAFDRRYRAVRTGRNKHIAGKNINLNIGMDFSIANYGDISSAYTLGLNGAALLGPISTGVGALTGGIGAGAVSAVGNFVIAQGTVTSAEGVSMTTSTSVNTAVLLVVQKAEIEITLKEHEKCAIAQFTPEFIDGINMSMLRVRDGVERRGVDYRSSLARGLFICGGEVFDDAKPVMEDYYYVTQHFTAGDMLDENNLLNHVWLLSLRGQREFDNFVRIIKAKEVNSKGEVIADHEKYNYSLSHLEKVYQKMLPTFPGLYAVPERAPQITRTLRQ
ncbi:MAG: trichohyalin-plectin-homology domain domain-containing protein [Bdellovibrionaceae bacterium]|nr:trichohyalin-plectin-homology domain domain-containing protein [Pseudobdellovibrionaceae bacterium]